MSAHPAAPTILILGGVRSGKSAVAEQLAAELAATQPDTATNPATIDYVATARHIPGDEQWQTRIAAHRERRPASWHTIETIDVAGQLRAQGHVILIESVTTWLANVMEDAGCFDDPTASITAPIAALVQAWQRTTRPTIAVSDEVGLGGIGDNALARRFADELGSLNQQLASEASKVLLVVAGQILVVKAEQT